MADQSNIDDAALQIATLVNKAREELTQDLYYLGLQADDLNAFALQLFIQKATDENGVRMFAAGHAAELKNDCRDADLQALMLAVISEETKDSEEFDIKK